MAARSGGTVGASLGTDTWRGHVPAFAMQAADTAAAGDTFIGAFVTRLVEAETFLEQKE
jgi:sugar/nucleoside kinase (ribokinase family)